MRGHWRHSRTSIPICVLKATQSYPRIHLVCMSLWGTEDDSDVPDDQKDCYKNLFKLERRYRGSFLTGVATGFATTAWTGLGTPGGIVAGAIVGTAAGAYANYQAAGFIDSDCKQRCRKGDKCQQQRT